MKIERFSSCCSSFLGIDWLINNSDHERKSFISLFIPSHSLMKVGQKEAADYLNVKRQLRVNSQILQEIKKTDFGQNMSISGLILTKIDFVPPYK